MYVKGSRNPNSEICIDKLIIQVSSACKLERFSTPKSKVISATNISEKIAILMTNMGITSRDLDSYPTAINLLLYNALWQCRENPPTNWANNAYNLLQRYDLAAHSELLKKVNIQAKLAAFKIYLAFFRVKMKCLQKVTYPLMKQVLCMICYPQLNK